MSYGELAAGCISKGDFAARLVAGISPDEWGQLEQGGFEGEISDFNRTVPSWTIGSHARHIRP